MIRLETGSPSDYWPRIKDLVLQNVYEVAGDIPVNVDPDLYQKAYDSDQLITLFSFNDDELVGYAITWVTIDPHNVETKKAVNDIIYVSPEHRMTEAGIQLIAETESIARMSGASSMTWEARPGSGFDQIMRILGYEKSNTYKRTF